MDFMHKDPPPADSSYTSSPEPPMEKLAQEFESTLPPHCDCITPDMLKLVQLNDDEVEHIVRRVPGGARNVQDIYPLTPLQEGMLFHHLLNERTELYVLSTLLEINSQSCVDALIASLQMVVDRNDILRTAIFFEDLTHPVQVVYRHATLNIEHLSLDRNLSVLEQMTENIARGQRKWNLRHAPLIRVQIAADRDSSRWYACILIHHVICDHGTLRGIATEASACMAGKVESLALLPPFRTYVAQSLSRKLNRNDEAFFREKLGSVKETTAPFGLCDVRGDGTRVREAGLQFSGPLSQAVRVTARRLGVTPARLFHAAWAMVVAQTTRRDDVVFGTALLASSQRRATAGSTLGMFVNTLPLRLNLSGVSAIELVDQTQRELSELLEHEEASLIVAQRSSGLGTSAPLFTSLIGYRHSVVTPEADWSLTPGVRAITANQYRTNYPVTLTVDNLGQGFALTVQTDSQVQPERVAHYVQEAMLSLTAALDHTPDVPALALSILPEAERREIVEQFSTTGTPYPHESVIHEVLEQRTRRIPDAIAAAFDGEQLTFLQLDERANQLANFLRSRATRFGEYIPVLMPRGLQALISQLAILKVGCIYVPIDISDPVERQAFIVRDCGASRVMGSQSDFERLGIPQVECIDPTELSVVIRNFPALNIQSQACAYQPAYIMYTSGTTGTPKGVLVTHEAVLRLAVNNGYALIQETDCVAHYSNPAFDASTFEIWVALLNGARVCAIRQSTVLEAGDFRRVLTEQQVTVMWMTAGLFTQYKEVLASVFRCLNYLVVGGDVVEPVAVQWVLENCPPRHLLNGYGPTECTTFSAAHQICSHAPNTPVPIGRPISNTSIYILDKYLRPSPIGVAGEIYIGGPGVALGYLNHPELTAERFIPSPFGKGFGARLYKSGDRGRWQNDGSIEYLGRCDDQIKIRGYRLEPAEITAQLMSHPDVKEAVVFAHGDGLSDRRLIAYIVADTARLKTRHQASAGDEVVSDWQMLYEQTYSNGELGPSFVGWNSSYTGGPIPLPEMQEWLNSTLDGIRALRPNRVLEIGCGVGLLLEHLAPECTTYVGTDFSRTAIERLGRWVAMKRELQHVRLLHREALELDDLRSAEFDLVILNSVVQYFPDIDYLVTLMRALVRVVRAGGSIFIGDVRHFGTLSVFHSAVELARAAPTARVGQLRHRIARAIEEDKELVIDPMFFQMLAGNLPQICSVDVQVKRGRADNELTHYRYDTILRVGKRSNLNPALKHLLWDSDVGGMDELERILKKREWPAIRVEGVPNLRLCRETIAQTIIHSVDARTDAGSLRQRISDVHLNGVHPESIWSLAAECGYAATVSPACSTALNVTLVDRSHTSPVPHTNTVESMAGSWSVYANDPFESRIRQQLLHALRAFVKTKLPDYMIPSAWVSLRKLPLTPNGKVHRQALPPPPDGRPDEVGEYVAPQNALENRLAHIWSELLPFERIGIDDNFFDLGGHSLLATRVTSRINERLHLRLAVRALFESPTIRSLASYIESITKQGTSDESAWIGKVEKDIRDGIESMSDEEVLSRIQALEQELRRAH